MEKNAIRNEIDRALEEQTAILEMDDIVDFESDEEDGGKSHAQNETAVALSPASHGGARVGESSSYRKSKESRIQSVPIPSFDTTPSDSKLIVIE